MATAWRLPRPAAVYCDFEDVRRYKDAVPRAQAAGMPIGLATLRILKPGEEGFQSLVAAGRAGHRARPQPRRRSRYFREHAAARCALVGDFSLNVANELTADLLIRAGLDRLVPSYDLNWEQFAADGPPLDSDWFEAGRASAHAHVPHGALRVRGYAIHRQRLPDCGRPCDRHKVELRDRAGASFPVHPDTGCRNTVYNAVPQSGAEYIHRMRELGIGRFRIDLLRESPQEAKRLLDCYARVVAGLDDGRETWRRLRALNQLGVTRGTLQLV